MDSDLEGRFRVMATAELPRLRRFARAVTYDPYRADDLVQGALERMYVAWPRAHGVADPGAYLRTVLVRLAVSESRRPWRREHVTDVLPEVGPGGAAGAASDSATGSVLRLDLTRALAGLTVKQRAIVVMRYVEDRSVDDVASVLGIAAGTVKRQSSDAVAKLRRTLGEDFLHDPPEPTDHPSTRPQVRPPRPGAQSPSLTGTSASSTPTTGGGTR